MANELSHQNLLDHAGELLAASVPENTALARSADWRSFSTWCDRMRACPIPANPATVALYVAELSARGLKRSTVARRLSTIRALHAESKLGDPCESPEVEKVWQGFQNTHTETARGVDALRIGDVRRILQSLDTRNGPIEPTLTDRMLSARDASMLLLAYAGALREIEIVSLELRDVEEVEAGIQLHLRHRKHKAEETWIPIPFGSNPLTCPVRAFRAWTRARTLAEPALRYGPESIAFCRVDRRCYGMSMTAETWGERVKVLAARAGLDGRYSGHSPRRGFCTDAAERSVPERWIRRTTGHLHASSLEPYIDLHDTWANCAASKLGL